MNNPPAFPKTVDGHHEQQDGMDLRDYFAAAALQGNMASFAGLTIKPPTPEDFAKDAYQQADAMLAEREKQTK